MTVASDTRGWQQTLRRGWLRLGLMVSVPLILALGAGYWYLTAGRYAETDDAFAQADIVQLSADVGGRVVGVDVKDNERVARGQELFRLDESNYRIALNNANAALAAAQLQVDGWRAAYREKQASLKQAQDTLAYQQRETDRQQQLLAEHVTSQQKFDDSRHTLDMARQQVSVVQEQIASTLAQLGGNPDLPTGLHPLVQQAQARVDQAALDLSHSVVYAPMDGIVTNVDKLPVGYYLNASTPAFSLVSTGHVWIEANFKETDLTHMRPGQQATVSIDTYPDYDFTARVESIGAGTGSEFSVLPPQNASGNWVKVVQRIPVRLVIENPDPNRPLRAGMSADVSVDTQYRNPTVAWIGNLFAALTGSQQ